MKRVNLQPVTSDNLQDCLNLKLTPQQRLLIASNDKSLAEAKTDPTLTPLAIYDWAALGHLPPKMPLPMLGFVMYERKGGLGFILRIMIDIAHQQQGYGRATLLEVIRRLRLYPDVQMIATSHLKTNVAAAALFHALGFVPWDVSWASHNPHEQFLRLYE